jgi:4-hydroxy-tetrahydrodipicolinate synthase
MKFEGIYTPVITPYRDDYSIDYERLGEVVDFLIDAGVHGIISAGTTGEYYAQSMAERFELMKFIQQRIKGRTSYIVGTGALRTEESIEYAQAAVEVGADALLVATPPYSLPTERENALHALAIDRVANLPIILYNYPHRMGSHMGEEWKARVTLTACTCWRVTTRTFNCPAAWTTRRWNSSPGARAPGSAPVPISRPRSISRCTRPARSRETSTRAAGSCRRCCR